MSVLRRHPSNLLPRSQLTRFPLHTITCPAIKRFAFLATFLPHFYQHVRVVCFPLQTRPGQQCRFVPPNNHELCPSYQFWTCLFDWILQMTTITHLKLHSLLVFLVNKSQSLIEFFFLICTQKPTAAQFPSWPFFTGQARIHELK